MARVAPSDYTASSALSVECLRRTGFYQISRVRRMRHLELGRDSEWCNSIPSLKAVPAAAGFCVKRSATTPHSISHSCCLPVRPGSGAGFVVAAHYRNFSPHGLALPSAVGLARWRRRHRQLHHLALQIPSFTECYAVTASSRTRPIRVRAAEPQH